jgi:hypothetical protein
MDHSSYQPGDRVRDTRWDGQYEGTVNRVDDDGDVYVTWDGYGWIDYQYSPDEVRRIDVDVDEA